MERREKDGFRWKVREQKTEDLQWVGRRWMTARPIRNQQVVGSNPTGGSNGQVYSRARGWNTIFQGCSTAIISVQIDSILPLSKAPWQVYKTPRRVVVRNQGQGRAKLGLSLLRAGAGELGASRAGAGSHVVSYGGAPRSLQSAA
jgi:hypothetical protein